MATLQVGQRVVRSDTWTWPDQDGGRGHMGTVVSLPGHSILEGLGGPPLGWVRVRWDIGNGNNYRAGGSEKYDLLLFDNAPAGVVHSTIICDHCGEDPIAGMRWKCSDQSCPNYDLCTRCYMANEHDVTHTFIRFASPNETGVQVGPRFGESSTVAKGIFPGATVQRGKDWRGRNADGGAGKEGRVVEITNHDGVPRSAAQVQWGSTKSTSKHQVGFNGKMELSLVRSESQGPSFYPRHLPHLGKGVCLKVGDFVAVTLDVETLEAMQVANGLQWTAEMEGVFGKVAKITSVDSKGNVQVLYGRNKSFVFHPEVLSKIPNLGKGDRVRVIDDLTYVKRLQDRSMNGWVDGMEKCLGMVGEVSGIDIQKNARVKLVGIMNELSWHPCTLEILKKISPDSPTSDILPGLDGADLVIKALMSLLGDHADDESSSSSSSVDSEDEKDKEFMEIAKSGNVERAVEIITASPDRVNHKVNGKSALHRAAVQGHLEVVMALVEAGADLNATDNSGNTPLMFAVEGDEPAVAKYLTGKGADMNRGNKNSRRAVHLAAYKGLSDCMRILINSCCDVNVQDDDGDTAIHDAVNKGGADVIELLLDCRELDLALANKRKLTPLQFAAFLDRPSEAELIVKAFPKSITIPREDGNTVLHIAAVNNHAEVIKKILAVQDHGLCLDSKNDDALTALHLACSKGQTQCIELLVAEGADINCQGQNDNCALHILASSRTKEDVEFKDSPALQKIRQTYQKHGCDDIASALLIFMVKHGASVTMENTRCRTPLSYVKDPKLRATLKKIARGESVSDDIVDMSTWEDLGEDEDVKAGRMGGDRADEEENNIVAVRDGAKTAGRTRRQSERVSEGEPGETGSASKTAGSGLAGTSSPGVQVFDLVHQVGAQELNLGNVIGTGQFGTVYRAIWHGTPVAVKKISFLGSKQSDVEKEVAIHRRASHPNIVQMMALGYEGSHAYLVMQLIEGKALAEIIFPTKSGPRIGLNRGEKLQISRGILQAVSYMHACNILHLDIKPANILIETVTKRPYICDLGLAHIKNRNAMSQSSVHMRGTPCYMPPETLAPTPDAKHSNKHDVWSVAGTLVELHSEQHLWGEGPLHPIAFLANMLAGKVGTPPTLTKVDSGVRKILEPCFKQDPDQRPSAQQLLEKFNALK